MDELRIILEDDPVLIVQLDGNQGITDPPDPYQTAVTNGYHGTKEQWLNRLFEPTAEPKPESAPDLLTLYRLAKA